MDDLFDSEEFSKEIDALNEQAEIFDKSYKEMAETLFEEMVLKAVLTISSLMESQNDNIRMKAAVYVNDRVLGPAGKVNVGTEQRDFLKELQDLGSKVEI